MNRLLIPALALLLAAAITFPAGAQSASPAPSKAPAAKEEVPPELRTPRVDKRMERMRRLILDGIEAGTLTKGEALSLNNELKRIDRSEERAKQNRQVTPRERRLLNKDINDLHERIWRKTHNDTKPAEPLAAD